MNKIVLLVALCASLATPRNWKYMGVADTINSNEYQHMQNNVCSNNRECSSLLGTEWCCASAECETSGYKTKSSQCNLWFEDGETDVLGVKCVVKCFASSIAALGAAVFLYLLTLF